MSSGIDDNATMLDTGLFTDTEEFKKAGVYLEDLFISEGLVKNRSQKRRSHLQLILANLLRAHNDGKESVSFSRNRNDYTPPFRRVKWKECSERYSPFGATHDPLIHTIEHLIKLGLVGDRKGYRDEIFPGAYVGSWSRMWATEKLLEVVEKQFNIDVDSIGFSLDNETVILRDQDKNPMDYEDTETTIQMRKDLKALNMLLQETTLTLSRYENETEEEHNVKLNRPYRKFMYRVFNNGSFERGGRFNGGHWISGLPKYLRERIRINGHETVLWDFETMNMNLLYNYADLQCQPGASPGWWRGSMEAREWPDLQKIHKKLMSFALNIDSIDEWRSFCKDYYSPKKRPKQGPVTDRMLLEFLYNFHAPIKDLLFNKDLGLRLMYTESRITDG